MQHLNDMWPQAKEAFITERKQQIQQCMEKRDRITCFKTSGNYTAGGIDLAILEALLKGTVSISSKV